MKTGVVKFFNMGKGFGFITVDGTGEDVFVHQTGLVDMVTDGDLVSFNLEQGKRVLTLLMLKDRNK